MRFNSWAPPDPSSNPEIGVPTVTMVCGCASKDAIIVGCDSKVVWSDERPDEIGQKIFVIGNFIIGVAHRHDYGERIAGSIELRKNEISSDALLAVNGISRIAHDEFGLKPGFQVFSTPDRDHENVQLALYGWGIEGGDLRPYFCTFDALNGFNPAPSRPDSPSLFIGSAQSKKCLLDFLIQGSVSTEQAIEAVYYTAHKTLEYHKKQTGGPIKIFVIRKGNRPTECDIGNTDEIISKFDQLAMR